MGRIGLKAAGMALVGASALGGCASVQEYVRSDFYSDGYAVQLVTRDTDGFKTHWIRNRDHRTLCIRMETTVTYGRPEKYIVGPGADRQTSVPRQDGEVVVSADLSRCA